MAKVREGSPLLNSVPVKEHEGIAVPACANCRFAISFVMSEGLRRVYSCRRYPPQIPMPGPGGQGVNFIHPNVMDTSWCGEHQPVETTLAR